MKLSDLEQRMKKSFEEADFSPGSREWERIAEALKPRRSSALPLLLPFHKAVAAAALLAGLGTSGLYLFLSHNKQEDIALSAREKTAAWTPAIPQKLHKRQITEHSSPYPAFSGIAKEDRIPATPIQPASVSSRDETAKTDPALVKEAPAQQEEQPLALHTMDSAGKKPFMPVTDNPGHDQYPAPGYTNNSLRLGFVANIGKPSLGNVQYNVGLIARQPVAGRFFAEANISLSSSSIRYTEQGPALLPTDKSPGDGLGAITTPPDLNFVNNIISVGIAPSFGCKVTPGLSVSVGGDLYKALNTGLKAELNGADRSAYANYAIPQRKVTDLDFGLKAQVEYKVNRNFSLSSQYRQGLTDYLHIDGKALKNSNVTFGLKYYFLKVQ